MFIVRLCIFIQGREGRNFPATLPVTAFRTITGSSVANYHTLRSNNYHGYQQQA